MPEIEKPELKEFDRYWYDSNEASVFERAFEELLRAASRASFLAGWNARGKEITDAKT